LDCGAFPAAFPVVKSRLPLSHGHFEVVFKIWDSVSACQS
jgi:hypothetical protein